MFQDPDLYKCLGMPGLTALGQKESSKVSDMLRLYTRWITMDVVLINGEPFQPTSETSAGFLAVTRGTFNPQTLSIIFR